MDPVTQSALAEFRSLTDEMDSKFIKRTTEIEILATALIAREHVFFEGPPGTAKSLLINCFAGSLGCSYFSYLIRKDSTPEELFGMWDLAKLKNGVYERILDGRFADCQIVFADEIWKGSSGGLNGLLTLANEREFDNGTAGRIKAPLEMICSASNELPQADDLNALYDRFLFKRHVGYLTTREDRIRLMEMKAASTDITINSRVSMQSIELLRDAADLVDVSGIVDTLADVMDEVARQHGIVTSDRTLGKLIGVLQARAVLQGRDSCVQSDLLFLAEIMVENPVEDHDKVLHTIAKLACPDLEEVMKLHDAAVDLMANGLDVRQVNGESRVIVFEQAVRDGDGVALGALNREMKNIVREAQNMTQDGQVESLTQSIVAMSFQIKKAAQIALMG